MGSDTLTRETIPADSVFSLLGVYKVYNRVCTIYCGWLPKCERSHGPFVHSCRLANTSIYLLVAGMGCCGL